MRSISVRYVTRLTLNIRFCLLDSPRLSLTASYFAAVLSACPVRISPRAEMILAAGSDPVMRQFLFATVNIQPVLNIMLADHTVYSCFCLCLPGQMFLIQATWNNCQRQSLQHLPRRNHVVIYLFVAYLTMLRVAHGPGSSVSIATDYGLDGPGSKPDGDEIFRPSRPALGPTQPPT